MTCMHAMQVCGDAHASIYGSTVRDCRGVGVRVCCAPCMQALAWFYASSVDSKSKTLRGYACMKCHSTGPRNEKESIKNHPSPKDNEPQAPTQGLEGPHKASPT